MLALLRELFEHQAYADAALMTAIARHEGAAGDEALRTLLHHILIAHRFWLHLCRGVPFEAENESLVPDSLAALAERYRETQARDREWLAGLDPADLDRRLESPYLPGRRVAVREALLQVCLHSQGHRAQCATRLRLLGGEPPALDYVLWCQERPLPGWPGGSPPS
jgi:uncharacterized damage-inducible protein DinB